MKDKLLYISAPFVLALVLLTVGYTALHWLLFVKLDLFSLQEGVTHYAVPIVLSGIAAWYFLRSRLRGLRFESGRGRWRDFYCLIAWVGLTVPTIMAQYYMETSSGRLTTLRTPDEISKVPATKYYSFRTYHIDKRAATTYTSFITHGKYNEKVTMHLYVAVPMYRGVGEDNVPKPSAWLGTEYRETISNRLDVGEKRRAERVFFAHSMSKFADTDLSRLAYFDRIRPSGDRDGYMKAIMNSPLYAGDTIILTGSGGRFGDRNDNKLSMLLIISLVASLVWLLFSLIPHTDPSGMAQVKGGASDREMRQKVAEGLRYFIPKGESFITLVLFHINTLIFLLMSLTGSGFISFDPEELVKWGGDYYPLTAGGEWWRLLTSTFLHAGAAHLVANMVALLLTAPVLEALLGRAKFAILYLTCGVLSSLVSLYWHDPVVIVGASGAIFGLFGASLLLALSRFFAPWQAHDILVSTAVFAGLGLLIGFTGNADNAGHIGGLLSGLVGGLILIPFLRDKKRYPRKRKGKPKPKRKKSRPRTSR